MIFYDPWTALVILLTALGLDRWLGQPYIYHPLVGFSRLATALAGGLRLEAQTPRQQRLRGAVAMGVLLLPVTVLLAWLDHQLVTGAVADILLLYLVLGLRNLADDGQAVAAALEAGDLSVAREQVGLMSHHNTVDLNEQELTRSTVEAVLSGGNESVVASLFWFLLAGGAGAVGYRLVNTLASLWGQKSLPYLRFGRAAEQLDRVLGWLPARLTVLLYALAGRSRSALGAARRQGSDWAAGNDGPVMAAGATALGLVLGGDTVYGREQAERPLLGQGRAPQRQDIVRAQALLAGSVRWLILLQLLIAGVWSLV